MFLQSDILEFINKIINQSKASDKIEVKQNITKFRDYLKLTQMVDSTTIEGIDIIIDCIDELMTLKGKLGDVDVTMIFQNKEESISKPRKLEKTRQSMYDEKHYKHYVKDSSSSSSIYSSNCGMGSPSYRSC